MTKSILAPFFLKHGVETIGPRWCKRGFGDDSASRSVLMRYKLTFALLFLITGGY